MIQWKKNIINVERCYFLFVSKLIGCPELKRNMPAGLHAKKKKNPCTRQLSVCCHDFTDLPTAQNEVHHFNNFAIHFLEDLEKINVENFLSTLKNAGDNSNDSECHSVQGIILKYSSTIGGTSTQDAGFCSHPRRQFDLRLPSNLMIWSECLLLKRKK